MEVKFVLGVACGLFLRVVLLSQGISQWLSKRIEISTPVSSWRRVVEGITLLNHGYSPYEGDMYHQSPLLLSFFHGVWRIPYAVDAIFLLTDILIAVALHQIATLHQRYIIAKQKKEQDSYAEDTADIRYQAWGNIAAAVAMAYWLNPFAIVTCAAHTTTALTTLTLSWSILAAMRGKLMASCLGIAVAAHLDPYLIMMAIPVAMLIAKVNDSSLRHSIIKTLTLVGVFSAALIYLCFSQSGSWDFIHSTYGFVLTVPDFTPNVGIFWYLFTEMFEHFRTFFLWVFQLHVFFYLLPLGMRLRDHPFFLVYLISHVVGVFKSYPALGDTALPLTLLFMWKHLFVYVRSLLVVSVMFLASIVLMPTFWYLWILAGSGNANFFYSGTLAYNLAHVILLGGSLTAFLRREFDLKHGCNAQLDGKPAVVRLE